MDCIKGANKTPTFVLQMAAKTPESALDCDHECTTPMALMPVRSETPEDAVKLQQFFAAIRHFVCDGISQIPPKQRVYTPFILPPIARDTNVSTNGNAK